MIALFRTIDLALDIYTWIIIASAVFSWLYAFNVINSSNRFVASIGEFLYKVTEPVLRPLRNILPNLGGIDISPIGVLVMEDNSGKDEKIIAVPSPKLTQRYEKVHDYSDLPEITLKQIAHFFEHYKDLEPGKWVKIGDWGDEDYARKFIVEAIERAKGK